MNIPVFNTNEVRRTREKRFSVPRRALFDIRQQLMAETSSGDSTNDDLLSGLESGDRTSGKYEGGFKTWECAVDLAGYVAHVMGQYDEDEMLHIIELGAGSGIPTLTVLRNVLEKRKISRSEPWGKVQFTLCDYNEDVLRLATVPNLLLGWCKAFGRISTFSGLANDSTEADLDDIDENLLAQFVTDCQARNTTFGFVSGAWGKGFLDLVCSTNETAMKTLILASETIYSPLSLNLFIATVLALLGSAERGSKALIAAKEIYFGVGGGVDDFILEVQRQGGQVLKVLDVRDEGIGRVIFEVTLPDVH